MKAPLYSKEGHKKGELVLNPVIFGVRVNDRLLELVMRAYSGNIRRGTASTKTRKEVRGGGKKPWRQKGTGRARASSIRSPLWRGGGTVFGPKPRSYVTNLPVSMRRSALIAALSLRAHEKKLLVVEDMRLEAPKTKELVTIMNALHLSKFRTLCVVKELPPLLKRASQNLKNLVKVKKASDISAFDVIQEQSLLIEQEAVSLIEDRLKSAEGENQRKTVLSEVSNDSEETKS